MNRIFLGIAHHAQVVFADVVHMRPRNRIVMLHNSQSLKQLILSLQ